jgi:hypothetical protein
LHADRAEHSELDAYHPANRLMPVAISCETAHIGCVGEGIFVQRLSALMSLFSTSFEEGKMDMRAIGNRGIGT